MSPERVPISACVIAMNEEDNIERCLASLDFCDETILVDSHSTDRTRELAAARGARVIERDWPGFGVQKQFAVDAARNDWVLCLDADERLSDALRSEILALAERGMGDRDGYEMPRLSEWFGTRMRRGGWYPDRQLRLYDRRRGRWGGRPPHEHVLFEGSTGRLAGDLLHVPYRSVEDHLKKIDAYTTTMAKEMYAAGRRASTLDLVFRPTLRFLRFYLFKLGLVHGWVGLLNSYLDAHYVRMKYAKLLCLQRGLPLEERPRGTRD